MKKLFALIATLRKGKKLQPYALNNSDQVSSDDEEVNAEEEEEEEEHDSLTCSEFESDHDRPRPRVEDKYAPYWANTANIKKDDPKSKHEKKTESVEMAPVPPKGSNSVGGSSGSGRSKEQKELDKVMAEIADLEYKMKLDEIHLSYFNLVSSISCIGLLKTTP